MATVGCLLVLSSLGLRPASLRMSPRLACSGRVRRVALRSAATMMSTEPAKGAGAALTSFREDLPLATKEKMFIDSIASFYNDEAPLLSDDDYRALKTDLEFEASKYVTMSRDELKFIIASSRYREGKPIMGDEEYDNLRRQLKKQNSAAVIHDAPTCKVCALWRYALPMRRCSTAPCVGTAQVDTGICKSDAVPDQGKNAILYLPGVLGAAVIWTELLFWTLRWDPLFSVIIGSPFIYVLGSIITTKILFQNPLVVSTTCPNCSSVINLYFGDVLNVDSDNVMATEHECPVCKAKLRGNRENMIVETVDSKGAAPTGTVPVS